MGAVRQRRGGLDEAAFPALDPTLDARLRAERAPLVSFFSRHRPLPRTIGSSEQIANLQPESVKRKNTRFEEILGSCDVWVIPV
jgi:hypothetical protein